MGNFRSAKRVSGDLHLYRVDLEADLAVLKGPNNIFKGINATDTKELGIDYQTTDIFPGQ